MQYSANKLASPSLSSMMEGLPYQPLNYLDEQQRLQEANVMSLEDLPNAYAHENAMRPLRQQQMQLGNDTTLSQLPGVRAQASMLGRKDRMEEAQEPFDIKAMTGKYSSQELERHTKDLSNFGTLLGQSAALIKANPLGGSMAAKQMFQQAGKQGLWNPQWDSLNPVELAKVLEQAGTGIMSTSNKVFLELQKASAQEAMKTRLLELKHENDMEKLRTSTAAKEKVRNFAAVLDKKTKASDKLSTIQIELAKTSPDDPSYTMLKELENQMISLVNTEREDAQRRMAPFVRDPVTGQLGPAPVPAITSGTAKPGSSPNNPIKLD